jgi:hypothetical protein
VTATDYAIGQKIARSGLHLRTIDRRVKRYLRSAALDVVNDFESVPGHLLVRARMHRPPPPSLGVEIGEFLYNARATLDYTACELARYNGKEVDERVEYPIFLQREHFRNPTSGELTPAIRNRIGFLADSHREIIERQQPFQATDGSPSDDPLWLLYRLSNFDRHQFLHVVATVTRESFQSFQPKRAGTRFAKVSAAYRQFGDGDEVARYRVLPGPSIDVRVETSVRFDIAFDEDSPVGGRSVVKTLASIGVRVGEIVRDFNWPTLR